MRKRVLKAFVLLAVLSGAATAVAAPASADAVATSHARPAGDWAWR